jgi:hypothetical protein
MKKIVFFFIMIHEKLMISFFCFALFFLGSETGTAAAAIPFFEEA